MMWLALLSTPETEKRGDARVLMEVLSQFTPKAHRDIGIKRVASRAARLGYDECHLVDMDDDEWLFDLYVTLSEEGYPVVDLNDPATPFEINWPQS